MLMLMMNASSRRQLLLLLRTYLLYISVAAVAATGTNDDDDAIENSSYGFELTQANNLQRQERVQRECEAAATAASDDFDHTDDGSALRGYAASIEGLPDDQLEHLLVDEKHRFLYCYVPKVSRARPRVCATHIV